ncbi:hypothetical protein Leryth_018098 [Lithospermum erythrorhizon]|nr:hypothetical protein Leryth_018098 [Lithospermum erythrorhizon]
MALQNIGASNKDDAFYRYKMPRMITKVEGRGNGIKTNIVNMVEIAKALARPASYTTRAEKERLKEGEAADEELKKLKKEVKKKGSTKDLQAKSSSRKKTSGSDEDHGSPPRIHADEKEDEDEDDIEWQTDTSMEAARLRIQEQLNAVTADMVMLSTDEPKSKSKSPPKPEENSVTPHAKSENGGASRKGLVSEIKTVLEKGVTASEFQNFLGSLSCSDQDAMTAIYEAVVDGVEKGFAKEVAKKKAYLAVAVARNEDSQLLLLQVIEEFSSKTNPAAAKEVALVLKSLYDADVLEEDYIVQWFGAGLTGPNRENPVWKNAKPFVEWLQSAESETEED